MPLQYDDIPGSWGQASKGWPRYTALNSDWAERAFIACSKEYVVPYGSYVAVGLDIRVENLDYLAKLTEHMATARVEDTDEIVRRVNKMEREAARGLGIPSYTFKV